jgi:hypothetical protein
LLAARVAEAALAVRVDGDMPPEAAVSVEVDVSATTWAVAGPKPVV